MKSDHTEKAMLLLQDKDVLQVDPDGRKFAYCQIGKAAEKSRATLVKTDGSSLYILRDISAALHRHLEYE